MLWYNAVMNTKEHATWCTEVRFGGKCNCWVAPIRCDDCGQFAKADDLEVRESWMGGYRHRRGKGCWSSER